MAILTVVFVWPVVGLGYLPNSTDFILQYYPNLDFLARSLRTGELPLWNPFLFAGTPYLADPQSQLLYIPSWCFLVLLDTETAARAIVGSHFFLAAIAFYAFLRGMRLSALPSVLGATIYAFSPYTTGLVGWLPMLISMAWMPLALLFFDRALARRSVLRAALAAAVLALQFFNGWPHGSYITAFALLALFAWRAVSKAITARSLRSVGGLTAFAALTGLASLGLAAPVLLPFLEFWRLSNYVSEWGLEAAGAEGNVTLLALLGVGGTEGHGAYIGMLALLLALIGALYGRDRRRWLYVLIAGFGLMVAFGDKAPLYATLYVWAPGFQTFHVPGRFMVLFVFGTSVLAAMGADAVLRRSGRWLALTAAAASVTLLAPLAFTLSRMLGPDAPRLLAGNLLQPETGPYLNPTIASHVIFAGAGAILFLAAIATRRLPGHLALWAALLLVGGDLLLFQGKDADYFSRLPAALRSPSPAAAIARITGESEFRVAGFHQMGRSHFMSDFPFNLNSALNPPNLALLSGLEDLQGYLPLRLRTYADYLAAVNGGPQDYHWALVNNFHSPLLDMLNMRYVMLRENEERLQNVTIATNPEVRPGKAVTIHPWSMLATAIQVYSYLGNAVELEDGRVVARITVRDASGASLPFDLRAGMETAEWAYDRPEVAASVKHSRAPIATVRNLPTPTRVYAGSLAFPRPTTIVEITIEQTEPSVELAVTEVIAVSANPSERYEEAGELDGAKLYRNRFALPRVLLVPEAESVSTPEEALSRLKDPGFDPSRKVLLEGYGGLAVPGSGATEGRAEIRNRSNNMLELAVSAASPGFLLVNELSYPGWNAYLDGRQVRVWVANHLFRAIEVPPGEHNVEFRFEPGSLKLGLALFLSTLALLPATAILHARFRQQRKENTSP